MIPPNAILIWTGTHAGIPSGFTRETTLDDKYPKAWGSEAVDTTGGASTHTHTATAHGHTLQTHTHDVVLNDNTSPANASNRADDVADNHKHVSAAIGGVSGGSLQNASVTWSSVNHEPPYYTVIFIKAASFSLVPSNAVAIYSNATVPTGYTFCDGSSGTPDLRNKYLKGAATSANAGTTGGALTHAHTVTHGHTANSHTHSGNSGTPDNPGRRGAGGSNTGATMGHRHTVTLNAATDTVNNYVNTTAGSGDTVEPLYKKMLAIQNTSGSLTTPRRNMIAMWLGSVTAIPAGWYLCDGNNGTPDLRDYFVKIANSTSELNNAGGANTHTHTSISHTHTATGTHTHTGSTGGPDATKAADTGGEGWATGTHTHNLLSVSSVTATYDSTTLDSGSAVDNQPPYRTVAYIMFAFPVGGSAVAFL